MKKLLLAVLSFGLLASVPARGMDEPEGYTKKEKKIISSRKVKQQSELFKNWQKKYIQPLREYRKKVKNMSLDELKKEQTKLGKVRKKKDKHIEAKKDIVKQLIKNAEWFEKREKLEEEEDEYDFSEEESEEEGEEFLYGSVRKFEKKIDGMFLDDLQKVKIDNDDPNYDKKHELLEEAIEDAKELEE